MKYLPWLVSVLLVALLAVLWNDSQSKLAQKDMELQGLKQQYDNLVTQSNNKIAEVTTKSKMQYDALVTEANAQNKQLTEDATTKLQLANQAEIQVRVGFRKAMLKSGLVAGFTNLSSQSIAVSVNVQRGSSGQSRNFELTLDPGKPKEIGEREGWAFIPGDSLTVSQPDHKSLSVQIP